MGSNFTFELFHSFIFSKTNFEFSIGKIFCSKIKCTQKLVTRQNFELFFSFFFFFKDNHLEICQMRCVKTYELLEIFFFSRDEKFPLLINYLSERFRMNPMGEIFYVTSIKLETWLVCMWVCSFLYFFLNNKF